MYEVNNIDNIMTIFIFIFLKFYDSTIKKVQTSNTFEGRSKLGPGDLSPRYPPKSGTAYTV